MKKIILEEFVDLINNATRTGETTKFRICENDYNIFSVEVNRKSVIYIDVSEESKYDIIFETLKKKFTERHEVIYSLDMCGKYEAFMIIDEKVVVDFNYIRLEGQKWLYLQYLHEGE